jgi:Domain of unknown function (DUF4158)
MPFPGHAPPGQGLAASRIASPAELDSRDVFLAVSEIDAPKAWPRERNPGGLEQMTPAEIIELVRAAGRAGRRGPPAGYARFPAVVSGDELAEFFFFDERDRRLIGRRRRDRNRLGFAVALATVRYLGRFLEDPAAVPEPAVRFAARELAIPYVSLAGYAASKPRWAHQAEIRAEYGYREFGDPAGPARAGRVASGARVGERGEPPGAV